MWMTAGLFVGMGVMMAGGLFMAGRVIRSVGLTAAMNGQDKIRTPGGDFRVEKDSDMGPRLLVYPRVSLELPGTSDAAESLKEAQSGIKVVTYHSNDPQVFVDDWYKSHLMQDFTRYEAADKPQIEALKLPELADASVVFVSERGNKLGIVALTMDEDGTQIALVRVNKSGTPLEKHIHPALRILPPRRRAEAPNPRPSQPGRRKTRAVRLQHPDFKNPAEGGLTGAFVPPENCAFSVLAGCALVPWCRGQRGVVRTQRLSAG